MFALGEKLWKSLNPRSKYRAPEPFQVHRIFTRASNEGREEGPSLGLKRAFHI